MDNMKSKQYDILKVLITMLVVIAHATRMYTPVAAISMIENAAVLSWTTDVIYAFHMPFYIMVSGMVYGLCVEEYGKYQNKVLFLQKNLDD